VYTILIIDDSEHVRSFLTDILAESGYQVIAAPDGEQGLEVLKREHPDCVLLDVILPGIDGLEVLRRIRETNLKIPVLMMTAEDPGWVRMSCESYGANGFLSKVFDAENIVESIENVIIEAET
jgi:DNA-binding response OmpR family regulator